MKTAVIVPALNEEGNIASLVQETLAQPSLNSDDVLIVVDNGSVDATATLAAEAGAIVISEPRQGYGYACAAGSQAAMSAEIDADLLLYLDGDYSSLPSEIGHLLTPIREDKADLILGSRMLGNIEPGSMPPHQQFGNWLTSWLMGQLYGIQVTDLGPYRAIRRPLLEALEMREMTFGWPTEMMVKSARQKARILEVPVTHAARRSGKSKVSGTIRGSVLAAYYILGVTFRYSVGR